MTRNAGDATIFWTLNEAGGNFSSLTQSQIKSFLSPNEQDQFAKLKIPKRNREWLNGRLTAKALITSPGSPLENEVKSLISIENHPEGAPYLASHPNIGSLSISHRDPIAVCAFIPAKTRIVGIDLELIENRPNSFAKDFFTEGEYSFVKDLPPDLQDFYITLIWSAKEAILKVWQKGLRLDTRRVEIFPDSDAHLSTENNRWKPIIWNSKLAGYPDCWLGWQQWHNYVITLAVSQPGQGPDFGFPTIIFKGTQEIYEALLGV